MSDNAHPGVQAQSAGPQITLYSGTNFTGKSCVLPADQKTYSLAATGLDKIASIKVPPSAGFGLSYGVKLYLSRPAGNFDGAHGTWEMYEENVSDTAEFAGAVCVRGSSFMKGMAANVQPEPGEREILETID
jgi:hypothetical protein